MLLRPLPLEYAKLIALGDRVRTTRERTTGRRFRRTSPRDRA
jgi:hypothetical protein